MTEEQATQLPTDVRGLRHFIDKQAHRVCPLMGGTPGLTKEQQIERVQKTLRKLARANEAAVALLSLVSERDFDAHQAEKQRKKDATNAAFEDIVADVTEEDDNEDAEEGSIPD